MHHVVASSTLELDWVGLDNSSIYVCKVVRYVCQCISDSRTMDCNNIFLLHVKDKIFLTNLMTQLSICLS